MNYDILIPIRIGLFTMTTAILIAYFFFLIDYIVHHKNKKAMILLAALHIAIMVVGLLLTGYAEWLQ